jgi:hypothetical protein
MLRAEHGEITRGLPHPQWRELEAAGRWGGGGAVEKIWKPAVGPEGRHRGNQPGQSSRTSNPRPLWLLGERPVSQAGQPGIFKGKGLGRPGGKAQTQAQVSAVSGPEPLGAHRRAVLAAAPPAGRVGGE